MILVYYFFPIIYSPLQTKMGMVYYPTQSKHFLVKAPESPGPHFPLLPPGVPPVLQVQQMILLVEPNWTRQSTLKTKIRIFPWIICADNKLLKIANKFYGISNFKTKRAHSSFKTTPLLGDIHKLRRLKISNFNPPLRHPSYWDNVVSGWPLTPEWLRVMLLLKPP